VVSYQLEESLRRIRVFDLLPCLQSLLSEGSICCPGSAQSYIFDYFIAGGVRRRTCWSPVLYLLGLLVMGILGGDGVLMI
jgi:hypothetical protein